MGSSAFDLQSLGKLQEVSAQIERHHLAVQRTITELVPWIPLFANLPAQFNEPQFQMIMTALRAELPNNIAFGQVHNHIKNALQHIEGLRILLNEADQTNASMGIPETINREQCQGMA